MEFAEGPSMAEVMYGWAITAKVEQVEPAVVAEPVVETKPGTSC